MKNNGKKYTKNIYINNVLDCALNHKFFIAFILGFTGIIIFMFYYFTVLLNDHNELFVQDTLKLFEHSFIAKNEDIIDNIERTLNIQKSAIQKYDNNLTQNDFFQISRSDMDPFSDVYNNYRYSKLIYDEDKDFYNDYGKIYIDSQYEIKNNLFEVASHLHNFDYYIPIEYVEPNTFAGLNLYGFDLYDFNDTRSFFDKFTSVNNKVIQFDIVFSTSVDEYDTGMYCGFINHDMDKCNITESDSFYSLAINNKNNKKCMLGFNYIAVNARDYINNILKSINTFPNIYPSNLDYVVFDVDSDKNIKIISRSNNFIDKNININKLSNVNKFKKKYYRTLTFNNFFKFKNNSTSDEVTIYIFFNEDIQNKEILAQIDIINILVPTLYISFLIFFIIIYRLYLRDKAIINDKYLETKKLMTYVNHELRNPLNIIYGITQITEKKITNFILELINNQRTTDGKPNIKNATSENIYCTHLTDDDFPHEHHKHAYDTLKEIHSNIMTAHNSARISTIIVNDVLDLQKLEDNKITLNNTYFTSILFINDFYKTIIHKNAEINSSIETFIYIDENILFYIDKDRLIQIVINIYTNSIKNTSKGKIILIIKYSDDKKFINIILSDTGCGIDSDIKKHIFKKTFSNNKSSVKSVGMGLYIVGMISKIIDCDIDVKSEIDVGTIFNLKIKNSENNKNKNNFSSILISESIMQDKIQKQYISINDDFNENDYIVDLNNNNNNNNNNNELTNIDIETAC
jgi:signal transduction histidine kinase